MDQEAQNLRRTSGVCGHRFLSVLFQSASQSTFEKRERAVTHTSRPPSPFLLGSYSYRRRRSDFKFCSRAFFRGPCARSWPSRHAFTLGVALLPRWPAGPHTSRGRNRLPPAWHRPAPDAVVLGCSPQTSAPARDRRPARRRNLADRCLHTWRYATVAR